MGPNWRQVYLISLVLRILFGLSNSYIHPDEHFQNFEVLTAKFFHYSTSVPWEFTELPIRSFGPLYVIYGPILSFISYFNITISPMAIWYLLRLQFIIVNWLIVDMCLYRILPTKPERIKAVFFTSTSYLTIIYQSHCFSNSIETSLVMLGVLLINDLRFDLERNFTKVNYHKLFYLGIIMSMGLFNRISFPGFFILPSLYVFKYISKFKSGIIAGGMGFLVPTILCILIDTFEFKRLWLWNIDVNQWVITPWNNLTYNTNYDNLSQHGIHPLYNHFLVNIPQIFGPGLIFICYKFQNRYLTTTPFLTLVSGLVTMSLIPHQELRFLLPILPLSTCCFDFSNLPNIEIDNFNIKKKLFNKPEKVLSRMSNLVNWIIYSWYIFNILMCILMGVFHQGGVIPVLNYLHSNHSDIYPQIWWRTYSPPTWLLGEKSLSVYNIDTVPSHIPPNENVIIDAMGVDQVELYKIMEHGKLLVAPISSINCDYQGPELKLVWKYNYHLDLDHLNFNSLTCITPGLGIYEIL